MKVLFSVLCVVCILSSCNKKYDDSSLWEAVGEFADRIAALEEWCLRTNTNISSLQTLVNALQDNDCITEVVPIRNDGKEVGYTIAFKYNTPITVYNSIDNENGEDGKNVISPIIRIKLHDDGNYYWTIQTGGNPEQWMRDADDNMVRANGKDGIDGKPGEDGKTPRIRINAATNEWEISADGSDSGFIPTGVKTTGSSTSGNDVFSDISETDDAVIFTLIGGETIVLPKNIAVTIGFERPRSFVPGQILSIPYSLTALNPASVGISIIGVTSGWKVEVDLANRQFTITAPPTATESSRTDAAILVYDGQHPAGVYPLPLIVNPQHEGVLINGTVWATANVDECYTFAANPETPGKYYQYNRRIAIASDGILPEYPNYEIVEWSKENDPCPAGWRLPTASEFRALMDSGYRKGPLGDMSEVGIMFGNTYDRTKSIFLPAVGDKSDDGDATMPGLLVYWSSSPSEKHDSVYIIWDHIFINNNLVVESYTHINRGCLVRCVRE